MLGKLKKFLFLLTAGGFSLILAACYGAPMENPDGLSTLGKNCSAKDASNNPIPGLRVQLNRYGISTGQALTDTNGSTSFHFFPDGSAAVSNQLIIEDIDGASNLGDFKTVTNALNDTGDETISVTMQPK